MLRSVFIIFISFGIAFGALGKDEGNSGEKMRTSESVRSSFREVHDRVRDNNMGKSELVHESEMPRIHRVLQNAQFDRNALTNNAFVNWLNLRKSDTRQSVIGRMEDYPSITKKAELGNRKLDAENELYGKMSEDDLLEFKKNVYAAENKLMNLIDSLNMNRLTFPLTVDDEYFCNAKEAGIIFVLYGREKSTIFQLGDNETLKKSGYDVKKNTEILIHDWLQDTEMNYEQVVSSYAQSNVSANLLFVDWSPFSRCEYMYTVNNTVPVVGSIVNKFIRQLMDFGTDVKKIHLIGHGIGAQIASLGAKKLSNDAKVARITGLDPAGPGYNLQPANLRLDKTDADFVDVIHTDMNFYGMSGAIGHVDFYPNGGDLQKGCSDNHLCNHQNALSYYLESLYSWSGFYGVECSQYVNYKLGFCKGNVAIMGEFTPPSTRGEYYLDTFTFIPHAKGKPVAAWKNIDEVRV